MREAFFERRQLCIASSTTKRIHLKCAYQLLSVLKVAANWNNWIVSTAPERVSKSQHAPKIL
jgi:hypothetical protein